MITKQNININFAEGLDKKTDPKQVSIGRFLSMENSVFTTAKRLTKRNGNQLVSSLLASSASATYLTTLNDNLTAVGGNVYAYNTSNSTWLSKGVYAPMEIDTLSLIRNSISQNQADCVVAPNGLICVAYTETNGTTTDYKYAIINSTTGQNVVAPTLIPAGAGTVTGSPKTFLLGNYFIIAFTNEISSVYHLQYIAISTYNPTNVTTAADLASAYVPSTSVAWDGFVAGDYLYIAYNTTTGGQSVKIVNLAASSAAAGGSPSAAVVFLGYEASIVSVTVDVTSSSGLVYVSWYYSGTGYMAAVSTAPNFTVSMIPVETITTGTILNLASAAQNGACTLFWEVSNSYGYDSSIPTNYIDGITVTPSGNPVSFHSVFSSGAGTITASSATGLVNGMYVVDTTTAASIPPNTTFTHSGTTLTLSNNTAGNSASSPGDLLMAQAVSISSSFTIVRSVGLASKAFIVDGVIYFLSAYESSAASGAGYQPTYFLINGSTSIQAAPAPVAKLAYSNGGGYLATGIPNVTVNGNIAQVIYLRKDLLEAQAQPAIQSINTTAPAVFTQTGINLATFTIGTQNIGSVEIAEGLQLTGGFGWMYDGYLPVEEDFLLWPDSVEVTPGVSVSTTGNISSTSNPLEITSITTTGIYVGMNVTDSTNPTAIATGTVVTSVGTSTVGISNAVVHTHSGDTFVFNGNLVSEVGSVYNTFYYQVIYRWTDNQGNVYRSAPSIPVSFTASADDAYTYAVLNIPTLRLTYKIANPLVIEVYRWSTANQVYYLTSSITVPIVNSTTTDYVTFVDVNSDTSIIGNEIIYTTGGVVEDINSPASNIITLFDTRAWKVDAEDPNLLWYSKQIIEAVPVEWSDLFTYYVAPNVGTSQNTGGVGAMAPMDDKLILFKQKGNVICFLNGTGPDNTGANSQYPATPYSIVSPVTCNNQASVVLTPSGLMFQASQGSGIWLLDRSLNVTYIGKDVESYNGSIVTSAVNVPGTTQIRFSLNTGEVLVYDYFFGQWDTFNQQSVTPTIISACVYEELHTYLNSNGQVYQESPGEYLDGTNPVLMQFTTGPIYLNGVSGYQRAVALVLTGSYLSPTQLVVQIAFNFGSYTQQYIITPTNATGVYGSDAIYGQTSPLGGPGPLMQWRIPLEMQLCQSFQISAQEVYDPSIGQPAGAGFTLSNINCEILVKSGRRPLPAAQTQG